VKIRTRIFAVVGVVILAAFLQALVVLKVEDRRAAAAYALDQAIWRLEAQADLARIIIDLDASERGSPSPGGTTGALATEANRLWELYERGAARMPDTLDTADSKRQFAAIDALMREWRSAAPGPARAALMARARGEFDRFESRERARLGEERIRVSSQSL
jgi:hypothetical protein